MFAKVLHAQRRLERKNPCVFAAVDYRIFPMFKTEFDEKQLDPNNETVQIDRKCSKVLSFSNRINPDVQCRNLCRTFFMLSFWFWFLYFIVIFYGNCDKQHSVLSFHHISFELMYKLIDKVYFFAIIHHYNSYFWVTGLKSVRISVITCVKWTHKSIWIVYCRRQCLNNNLWCTWRVADTAHGSMNKS